MCCRRRVWHPRSHDSDSRSENSNDNSDKKDDKTCEKILDITKVDFPYNKNLKIKSNQDGKYLSCHCFYPKDCLSEGLTKVMAEKRELEGQIFKILSKYEGMYEIVFSSKDYEMNDWKMCIKENEKEKEVIDVLFSNKEVSAFIIEKIPETENLFYIQDVLTKYYLNLSENLKRDEFSNYIVAEKEPKTKWELLLNSN